MPPRTQAFVAPQLKAKSLQSRNTALRRARKLQGHPIARRVLGVDPGLHRTGYGVIEIGEDAFDINDGSTPRFAVSRVSTPQLIEGGILRAKADDPLPLRLQTLHDGLREVLADHQPEVVVVEELFSTYAHPRSALLMAHARGVLMLAAQEAGVRVHAFTPNEVKQVITGNGHAGKPAVQSAVRARLKLNAPLNPPDVADALALALCFAQRQELGEALF
jgi:crossover junction endodeoxyribonuclease RuvC